MKVRSLSTLLLLVCLHQVIATVSKQAPVYYTAENSATLADIPSQFWPQYITTLEKVPVEGSSKKVPANTRGVLQRCQQNRLLVDFGRHGTVLISPNGTDFYQTLLTAIQNPLKKELPNLSKQIGNKLVEFSEGSPRPIPMESISLTEYYLFLYLDDLNANQARGLNKLSLLYNQSKKTFPGLTFVVIPNSLDVYKYFAQTKCPLPLFPPFLSKAYNKSLQHSPSTYPAIIVTDNNGKVVFRTDSSERVVRLEIAYKQCLSALEYPAGRLYRAVEKLWNRHRIR